LADGGESGRCREYELLDGEGGDLALKNQWYDKMILGKRFFDIFTLNYEKMSPET
jgi:hypothetical protein